MGGQATVSSVLRQEILYEKSETQKNSPRRLSVKSLLGSRQKKAESSMGGDRLSMQKSDRVSLSQSERVNRPLSVTVDVVNHEEPSVCSIVSNGPNNNGPTKPDRQVWRMLAKEL